MRILAIITGEYGRRHVDNIRAHGPADWQVEVWRAPAILPPVVDYPEDYVPESLPPADLILAFGEHRGVAELVPDVARMTGARAVIAPVDREEWLPRGLARQLRGWLAEMGLACVTPKPFCSLTETHYNVRRHRRAHDSPPIAEFARRFGQPGFRISVDPRTRTVSRVEVVRDACCGCARHVARGLVGVSTDEAEQEAGLLHHHMIACAHHPSPARDTGMGVHEALAERRVTWGSSCRIEWAASRRGHSARTTSSPVETLAGRLTSNAPGYRSWYTAGLPSQVTV